MFRSLRSKWILTWLLTSLFGIVLVGLLATRVSAVEFLRYRDGALKAQLIRDIRSFYEVNKSWEDIGRIPLEERFGRETRGNELDGKDGPLVDFVSRSASFVVADEKGVVVKAGGAYRPGDVLRSGERARGLPIFSGGKLIATVADFVLPGLDEAESRFLHRVSFLLIVAAGFALLMALIFGAILSRRFLRPLAELTEAIGDIRRGNFDQRVPVRSTDELGLLATAFNQMGEELQRAGQLREQMTADIAHELRTPLTVISGYLEGLRDGSFQATPEQYEMLFQEAQLLNRLIEDLRILSLADAGALMLQISKVRPIDLLEQVATSFSAMAEVRGISLTVQADDNLLTVAVDRARLQQVLGNLVSNALRYTPENGQIRLSAEHVGTQLLIAVSDDGKGIPPAELENIFARFYRADRSRDQRYGESGLGLAIAASIVAAHNGQIWAESELGRGTSVFIRLPRDGRAPID